MPTRRDSGRDLHVRGGDDRAVQQDAAARSGSKPAMARSTVVLPQPDSPSRQPMWPAGSDSVRSRTPRRARPGRVVGQRDMVDFEQIGRQDVQRPIFRLVRASRMTGNRPASTMASAATAPSPWCPGRLGVQPGGQRVEVHRRSSRVAAVPSWRPRTPAARWPPGPAQQRQVDAAQRAGGRLAQHARRLFQRRRNVARPASMAPVEIARKRIA